MDQEMESGGDIPKIAIGIPVSRQESLFIPPAYNQLIATTPPTEPPVWSSYKTGREIQNLIQKGVARDDTLWSYVSIGLITLGILLIFLGAAIYILTGLLTYAAASGGSGLIINAITVLSTIR